MYDHCTVLYKVLYITNERLSAQKATSGDAGHRGEIATVAAHRLDDEHAAFRAGGALLDAVTELQTNNHVRKSGFESTASGEVEARGSCQVIRW